MKVNTLQKSGIILGVVLIASALWQYAYMNKGQYPLRNFPPKGAHIMAVGDSLTEGIGATSKQTSYIGILQKRLNITIDNKGVSGATSMDVLRRLPRDILPAHPDIVILFIGSNDYLQQVPEQETFQNLRTIISRLQENGVLVVLIGARGGALHDTFADDFAALAQQSGSAFVPKILDGILGDPKFMTDQVHPNDAGYMKIADKIAPTLEGIILSAPGAAHTE